MFCFCVHYEHARYVMLFFDLYAFCINVVCYLVAYDIMIPLALHAVIRTDSVSAVSRSVSRFIYVLISITISTFSVGKLLFISCLCGKI